MTRKVFFVKWCRQGTNSAAGTQKDTTGKVMTRKGKKKLKNKKTNYGIQQLAAAFLCCLVIFQTPALAGSFADVAEKNWAYRYIEQAYDAGVIHGAYYDEKTGDRYFQPDSRLTIAQFLTIIGRAFYSADMEAFANRAKNWYDPAWELAVKYHLLDEKNGQAKLSKDISRYEMAEILYRMFEDFKITFPAESELRKTQDRIADFAEIKERNAERYITPIFYFGVLSGVDDKGTFAGDRLFTRAEMAVIYSRLSDFLAGALQGRHLQDFRSEVLSLINAERVKNGLSPVSLDERLNQAAQIRAEESRKVFVHARLDGRSPFTVFQDLGIDYSLAGENIAAGQRTPQEVVTDWMNSEGHRENILTPEFSKMGIGYTDGVWAQLFKD